MSPSRRRSIQQPVSGRSGGLIRRPVSGRSDGLIRRPVSDRIGRFIERRSRHLLALLLGLTLLFGLREAWLAGNVLHGWDAADYDNMATNLLAGKGFVHEIAGDLRGEPVEIRLRGHRPPAYPLFLASLYTLFGHHARAVYLAQALLFTLLGYIVYRLALLCFARRLPALLTILMYAFYLPLHGIIARISTEILFMLFLTLEVWFLVCWLRTPRHRPLVLSAVFLGLATLTRPTPFLLPFFLLFLFLAAPLPSWRHRVRAFAVHLLIALAVISPWMVRQAMTFGTFVPVTTGGGITLWEGTAAASGWTTPGWTRPDVPEEAMREFGEYINAGPTGYSREIELDRMARQRAIEIIRGNPGRYARQTLVKAPKFWLGLDFETQTPLDPVSARSVTGLLINMLLLVFAMVGAFRLVRARAGLFLIPALVILYFNLVHMFPYVLHRYSLPIQPLVMLFSAAAGAAILDKTFGRRPDPDSQNPLAQKPPEEAPKEECCVGVG